MNKVEVKIAKSEAVVNRPPKKRKDKGILKLFAIQLAVAAVLCGAVFACKYVKSRVTDVVCDSVRSAVTFDGVEYAASIIGEKVKDDG